MLLLHRRNLFLFVVRKCCQLQEVIVGGATLHHSLLQTLSARSRLLFLKHSHLRTELGPTETLRVWSPNVIMETWRLGSGSDTKWFNF